MSTTYDLNNPTLIHFIDSWKKGSYAIYTINENVSIETGKNTIYPREIILDMGWHQINYKPKSVEKLVSFLKSQNIIPKY